MPSEVLEGELVTTSPSTSLARKVPKGNITRRGSQYSPITPKKREQIIAAIKASKPEDGELFTLTSIARKARIPHKAFIARLHNALDNKNDKLHDFALDVMEAFGKQQEILMRESYRAAKDKGKWEGFFTFLERLHSDEFRKPSSAQGPAQVTNIGSVQTLALLQQNGELATGD